MSKNVVYAPVRNEKKFERSYRADQIQGSLIILNFAWRKRKKKFNKSSELNIFTFSHDDKLYLWKRWTYEFNCTFGIPVAASQDDRQESFVVTEVQVRVLLEKLAQLLDGSFADFRCFAQLHASNFKKLRGFRADVNIIHVCHVHNFSQPAALDDWSIIKGPKSFYSQKSEIETKTWVITDKWLSLKFNTSLGLFACCPMMFANDNSISAGGAIGQHNRW